MINFQSQASTWASQCFGEEIARDRRERNLRFIEEALELVQSLGMSELETQRVVQYVYSRSIGLPTQEVGGVMVTLAVLCQANHIDMELAGDNELGRCWSKTDQIRKKNETKPTFAE